MKNHAIVVQKPGEAAKEEVTVPKLRDDYILVKVSITRFLIDPVSPILQLASMLCCLCVLSKLSLIRWTLGRWRKANSFSLSRSKLWH